MSTTIERRVRSIMEDRRTDYIWPTKAAAQAVGCVPNKFSDWFSRTRAKLTELYVAMPGETAAELATIIARGEAERKRRQEAIHP